MLDGYRVVCVTPAGRRRYMRLLVAYILESPLVDEYQVWLNTTDPQDLAFLHGLPALDRRIRLIEPPEFPPAGFTTIAQFFRFCLDPTAVYVRFDDDVVWLEPDFFEPFLRFRLQHPRYFLTAPLIVNNALCSCVLQMLGRLRAPQGYINASAFDPIGWRSPEFAQLLHEELLRDIGRQQLGRWKFDLREVALNRFSINCISWLGSDFAEFGGVPSQADEEEWLTVIKPCMAGRPIAIWGQRLAAHFAFYTQREHLDRTPLLPAYETLWNARCGETARRLAGLLHPFGGVEN